MDRAGHTQEITKYLKATKVDAVFFATNYLGIYGIESIRSLGLRIGPDVGMVSFDDHDLFRLHSPSITCVSQPIGEIGRQIVDVLMKELNHASNTSHHLVLSPTLEIRQSSVREEDGKK